MSATALLDAGLLRLLDRLALTGRRAPAAAAGGEHRSARRGQSVEFADVRPYAPGDDIRHIDWSLSARSGRLFLRLFVAEEERDVHLLLDTSPSMAWGLPEKLGQARRALAGWGLLALAQRDRVLVHTGAAGSLPLRGRGAFPALAEALQRAPARPADLPARCRALAAVARGRSAVVCSDLLDERWRDALLALTQVDLTVVHVLAPQELAPELSGDLRLVDDEGSAPLDITCDADALRRYRARLAAWLDDVRQHCRERGITYLPLGSEHSLERWFGDDLVRAGIVRS
ncbi:MAG: DUF58 domain-containing protein [Chloroflexi bacterium]|nr:DUF58 domain-containing protein [Chloroflexota bacterium]